MYQGDVLQRLRVVVRPSVLPEGEHVGDVQGGGWKERRHLSISVLHPPGPLAWRCSIVHHPTRLWRAITHHPDGHGAQGASITLAPEVLVGIHHPGTQGAHGQSITRAPNTPMAFGPLGQPQRGPWVLGETAGHGKDRANTTGDKSQQRQAWLPQAWLFPKTRPPCPSISHPLPASFVCNCGYLRRTGCSPPPACQPLCRRRWW